MADFKPFVGRIVFFVFSFSKNQRHLCSNRPAIAGEPSVISSLDGEGKVPSAALIPLYTVFPSPV